MSDIDEKMMAVLNKLEQYDVWVEKLNFNDPRINQEHPGRPNCFLHSLPDGSITVYIAGDADQLYEKSVQTYTKFKAWLADVNTLLYNLKDYADSLGKPLWMVTQTLVDTLYAYSQEKKDEQGKVDKE